MFPRPSSPLMQLRPSSFRRPETCSCLLTSIGSTLREWAWTPWGNLWLSLSLYLPFTSSLVSPSGISGFFVRMDRILFFVAGSRWTVCMVDDSRERERHIYMDQYHVLWYDKPIRFDPFLHSTSPIARVSISFTLYIGSMGRSRAQTKMSRQTSSRLE